MEDCESALSAKQTSASPLHSADMSQTRLNELRLALTVAHYPGLSSHFCRKTQAA